MLVALLLFPFLWLATEQTKFQMRIELESSAAGVRLAVDGQPISVPTKLGGLKSVGLTAQRSFFPTGCESLVLTPAGSGATELAVPRRFDFPKPPTPLAGDWWVDRDAPKKEIFHQAITGVPGDFKLTGVFTGRSLGQREILLQGESLIRVFFRGGGLNNDIGLITGDGRIVALPMRPHPWLEARYLLEPLTAGLFGGAGLIAGFGTLGWIFRHRTAPFAVRTPGSKLVITLLIAGTLVSLWVARSVLDARPHFQDDLSYLLRAKWLLAGRLTLDLPLLAEHFSIPATYFAHGRWMSQYTIGWPALLALGEAFHAAWIVGPLCGLVLGYATWRLGAECGSKAVGFAAATLAVISPLGQILAGSMMSHTAASMWLALFLWLYVRGWRREPRGWPTLAVAGFVLGLAFTTRPLSACAIALPAGVYGLGEMRRLRFSSGAGQGLAAVFLGGLVGALPQFIDNQLVTGDPLLFAYKLCKNEGWALATYPEGLFWADRTLAQVPGMAFGWGWPFAAASPIVLALSLGFASVPFLAGRASRTDWLLLGVCALLPVAYMGFNGGTSLHGFGPRYYADGFFALFVLTARGFQVLAALGSPNGVLRALAAALFIALTASTAATLPQRLALHRGYNEIDDRIERALRTQGITRGLVLLTDPAYLKWIQASHLLPLGVQGDIVFAEKRRDNRALLRAYADRPVFIMDDSELRFYVVPGARP